MSQQYSDDPQKIIQATVQCAIVIALWYECSSQIMQNQNNLPLAKQSQRITIKGLWISVMVRPVKEVSTIKPFMEIMIYDTNHTNDARWNNQWFIQLLFHKTQRIRECLKTSFETRTYRMEMITQEFKIHLSKAKNTFWFCSSKVVFALLTEN